MKEKEYAIPADLTNRFDILEFEAGKKIQRKDFDKTNHIIFLLAGELEVVYGGLYPRIISERNMIFLTPLSNCVCKTLTPVRIIILGLDNLNHSCDKFLFQSLFPIFSLIKYEFRELEIRSPLVVFLELIEYYLKNNLDMAGLYADKMKELFILFRAYYNLEELAILFYPLLGKNMEFKKMVTDNYLRVKNVSEFAEVCGYGLGAFQRKFKDVFGETAYQWMQRQKAEQIKHRLMTSDVNLKELADELDFASPAHLNKFCKVWFGMTPSEVRQTFLLKKNRS